MNKNTNFVPLSIEILKSLESFGACLDGMDSNKIPLSARNYKRAAVFALKIIKNNFQHYPVEKTCKNSPALSELFLQVKEELNPTSIKNPFKT